MKQAPEHSLLYRALVVVGGSALLAAMVIDVLAVIGRATQIPLLGSIELVQYVVGIAGALAMVVATIHNRHAVVMILFSRLGDSGKAIAGSINYLCSVLFFLALFAGSLWLLTDLWSGFEESEFWHLQYRPLRIVLVGAMFVVACLFLKQAIQIARRQA